MTWLVRSRRCHAERTARIVSCFNGHPQRCLPMHAPSAAEQSGSQPCHKMLECAACLASKLAMPDDLYHRI